MAIFSYYCAEHGVFKVQLVKRTPVSLCKCGAEAKPIIKGGSVRVVERLDNGVMGRSIERLHNIEELMDERNEKYTLKQDEDED